MNGKRTGESSSFHPVCPEAQVLLALYIYSGSYEEGLQLVKTTRAVDIYGTMLIGERHLIPLHKAMNSLLACTSRLKSRAASSQSSC
jgi:hypothetical protein